MPPPQRLPLLRLMQMTDSSYPVGGYAYSHGMEWLVQTGHVTSEKEVAGVLESFIAQVVRHQWMPAAAAAFRARAVAQAQRIDILLDASILAEAEREAGRAMGRRLLDLATATLAVPRVAELRVAVLASTSPGQFAVVFGAVGRECEVDEGDMLAALGYSAVNSVTQAAIRLGCIGPEAAVRLVTGSAPAIAEAAATVASAPRQRIGAFAPMLELASMLQPTLRFRMFAS